MLQIKWTKLIYIYSHSTERSKIHIIFKSTWNIFKDRLHDRPKTSLNKFEKIEIISSIFSDHKGLKLETNPKGKNPKDSKSWRLNSMLLNNEWGKNEIREDIKNFLETNENELTTTQNLWDTAKAVLRGKSIAIQVQLKKDRNISNKQPNPTPTRTGGTTTKTAQSKKKEGTNHIDDRWKIDKAEGKNSVGNIEAKELISMTHGHELQGGMWEGGGGQDGVEQGGEMGQL